MKKNLFIILSFFAVLLAWCTSSDKQVTKIDPQEWEQLFDNQVEEFQYIKDLDNYLSYNVESLTEDKSFTSDLYLSAKFDENSSLQWWAEFSQKKISKTHNLETADIDVNIEAQKQEGDLEPFNLSWSISLLYKDNEMYANLHNFGVFMWEWNMAAKMYTLLWDLLIDNWVDLEVHSGWFVSLDENEDKRLPYIVWTLKNVLKSEWIKEDSPNFLGWIARLIDTVNSHIDLWISTNELTMISHEISYSELSDKTIQKEFVWTFQWKESAFDLSFMASKKWLDVHLYNIREYDEDMQDYKSLDSELLFSIQEIKKSEYSVNFQSLKSEKKIADIQWKIKYMDKVDISADFVLEPLELIAWEKISWKLDGYITKKSGEIGEDFPELTGNVLSLSELISSL